MSPQETAFDHLRVIRTLLERSQIYRTVSAPAALVGGTLAVVLSARFAFKVDASTFVIAWLAMLVITAKLNLLLLYQAAAQSGRPLVSQEFKHAVQAMSPAFVGFGLLGLLTAWKREELALASIIWVMGYGCGMLAASGFSPRSIKRLGSGFLAMGVVFTTIWSMPERWSSYLTDGQFSSLVMGSTFGVLHIGYAAAVFLRPSKSAL
ncbi:MAG: hypothetical protein JNJ83_19485 [Verrucomicrobiaceae bacterium]|nr:hypothetical protein [Verrucomicrobiaceae bacterium]